MSEIRLTYYGGAAFRIETSEGTKIMIDPFIKENPWCTAEPADFYDTDLILVTHGAFDHFGDTVEIMRNSRALLICGIEVQQYCLSEGIDPARIWITVDTSLFSDMSLIGRLYRPNILMIGISRIGEPYPCEMTPYEAALATQWIGPDVVIPMHYPKGSSAPEEFSRIVELMSPTVEVMTRMNETMVYRKFGLSPAEP